MTAMVPEAHDDRWLMERAIALARRCASEPSRVSPKVGAVVALDGVLLGEAFRGEVDPGDHAEFTLLERKLADQKLAGATLFTTLEPCTVRNIPKLPCAERIIDRRLRRVVIGVVDPNEAISGRGVLRLREAGIEIATFDPDLMTEIEELNREFTRLHAREDPSRRTRTPAAWSVAGRTRVGRQVTAREFADSIVAICTTGGASDRVLGTGFVADDFGLVLTATQVVMRVPDRSGVDPPNLKIRRANSSATTPVLWHSAEHVGAAVLSCGLVVPPLSISSGAPPGAGEVVTIFGVNAQSGDIDTATAQVDSVGPNGTISLNRFAMRGGYEGGPVIDRSGNVVGMLWQTGDDRSQELKPLVVPTANLIYALERARHPS